MGDQGGGEGVASPPNSPSLDSSCLWVGGWQLNRYAGTPCTVRLTCEVKGRGRGKIILFSLRDKESDVPTRLANKFIFNFVLEKSGIINIENKRTNLLPLSLTLPVQLHRHY